MFLTVGHQTPFDRLVGIVDRWVASNPGRTIFAQIGEGSYVPKHMEWTRWLSPDDFDTKVDRAEAVVAHAGTGTIIQALLKRKPLVVLPRLASLSETRNDHQVGTAKYFSDNGYLRAAFDEAELLVELDRIIDRSATKLLSHKASPELIERISGFLAEAEKAAKLQGSRRVT